MQGGADIRRQSDGCWPRCHLHNVSMLLGHGLKRLKFHGQDLPSSLRLLAYGDKVCPKQTQLDSFISHIFACQLLSAFQLLGFLGSAVAYLLHTSIIRLGEAGPGEEWTPEQEHMAW